MRHPLLPWTLWLLALVALAASLWAPDSVARRLGLGERVAERYRDHWRDQLGRFHRRVDATTLPGATVFIGASTVQGLNAAAVRACQANFGIGGETSAEVLERMGRYRSIDRAAAVVMMVGLNDVLRGGDRDLAGNYRRLLAAVPAGTPVILSSLPRLSPAVEAGRSHAGAIQRANAQARAACTARNRCRYVNLHGAMSDPAALTEADGIHLNSAGYALWVRLIRDALADAGVGDLPCQGAGGG